MLSADMYQENILEHYKNPHNHGALPEHNITIREVNPLCGDIIEMQMRVENRRIEKVKFLGKGCAISQAAASMLTDDVQGKNIEEALQIDKPDVLDMLGVEISPARLKCAFLGLKVLKLCLYAAKGQRTEVEE